jgi:hypothetical protein
MGMLERGGKVETVVVADRHKKTLQAEVRTHITPGVHAMTDELLSYEGLAEDYTHNVINHAEKYVDGIVHTNGMENYWSLAKRALHGTYVSVEPFHLFRYLDEQAFRYNNRTDKSNADRFTIALSQLSRESGFSLRNSPDRWRGHWTLRGALRGRTCIAYALKFF